MRLPLFLNCWNDWKVIFHFDFTFVFVFLFFRFSVTYSFHFLKISMHYFGIHKWLIVFVKNNFMESFLYPPWTIKDCRSDQKPKPPTLLIKWTNTKVDSAVVSLTRYILELTTISRISELPLENFIQTPQPIQVAVRPRNQWLRVSFSDNVYFLYWWGLKKDRISLN